MCEDQKPYFGQRAEDYDALKDKPWQQLQDELVWRIIQLHQADGTNSWLDVGGGDGRLARRLLQAGLRVVYVDSASEMRELAVKRAKSAGLDDNFEAYLGSAVSLDVLPRETKFDGGSVHNVLEYIPDRPSALDAVCSRVKPNGLLFLLISNPLSAPLRTAAQTQDPEKVLQALTEPNLMVGLEGSRFPVPPLEPEAVIEQLESCGFSLERRYGVRIFNDLMNDNQAKQSAGWLEKMIEVELEASTREPYRTIARHTYIVARRVAGG